MKKRVFGNTLKEQMILASKDKIHTFVMANKTIRGGILRGTKMVNEMRWSHHLGILETLVLGHAYLAGGLMTVNLKKKRPNSD